MEPVRRVVVPITLELLEKSLRFPSELLRIVEILPNDPMTYQSRMYWMVVEGPTLPIVREGETYQIRNLRVCMQPDGTQEVELL